MIDFSHDDIFVEHWMIKEYNLKGNEIILFSIITGSPYKDELCLECTIDDLCKELLCTKAGVYKMLKSLENKNLIKVIKEKRTDEEVYKELNIKNSKEGCLFCGYNKFLCLDKHHYPVRKKDGGTQTINLCPNCHRLFHIMAGDISSTIKIEVIDKETIRNHRKEFLANESQF